LLRPAFLLLELLAARRPLSGPTLSSWLLDLQQTPRRSTLVLPPRGASLLLVLRLVVPLPLLRFCKRIEFDRIKDFDSLHLAEVIFLPFKKRGALVIIDVCDCISS